jgi:hypothetical protein
MSDCLQKAALINEKLGVLRAIVGDGGGPLLLLVYAGGVPCSLLLKGCGPCSLVVGGGMCSPLLQPVQLDFYIKWAKCPHT